jgi:hypothetical protein
MIVVMAGACSNRGGGGAGPRTTGTTTGTGTVSATGTATTTAGGQASDSSPASPGTAAAATPAIPGLSPALVGLLGLDGPAAPATVDAKLFDDGSLRRVVDGTLAPLARPPAKLFKVKRPSADVDRADRDEGLIATAAGEVWLHHCLWAWSGDDDPCEADVWVQVAPRAKASATAPVERPEPVLAGPAGWTLAVEPMDDNTTGALVCAGPGSRARLSPAEASIGYSADDAFWISARPPIQIVKSWYPGMDDASPSDRFLAGCATADEDLRWLARGPAGFWALGVHDEQAVEDAALVLWHGRVVGQLPGVSALAFAP